MKIEAHLEKIKDAISRIQKVSTKNISLPILENVLITSGDNTLVLRTTNLHVGVEITVPVKVIEKGEALVKLEVFNAIINNLGNEEVVIFEVIDNTLKITTGKSEMSINLFPVDDFPTLPKKENEVEIKLPLPLFLDGIRSVIYAASTSDIKPEISSVYIYSDNNEVIFVSTDSFRLAEKRVVFEGNADFPGIIIPVKNINEFVKIFSGIDEEVSVFIGKNQFFVQSENIFFTSRLIDGNYPDYKQIIPKESKTEFVLLKEELVQSLRLVNIFSDSFNQILIKTKNKDGKVEIFSRNTDVGENETAIDAAIKGDDIDVYLNHKYLTDVFPVIGSDSMSFSFLDKNKAAVVRSVGDPSFLYLIMPMNR